MFPAVMFNSATVSEEARICSGLNRVEEFGYSLINPMAQQSSVSTDQPQKKSKKKRNLPGNPDPDAEVIALSPKSLMATNRFVCEICNKGFQREQNLQLHRRGHNLPWKLKQRNEKEMKKKRVYVCPERTCVHHHPSRALGDLTGIKKHFCRKHYNGEKKWKCEKCEKVYAVQSDWKAHSKTCGTKEYSCDCGTIFSRKDCFVTHRTFCDALGEESIKLSAVKNPNTKFHFNPPPPPPPPPPSSLFPLFSHHGHFPNTRDPLPQNPNPNSHICMIKREEPQELHINNTIVMKSSFGNNFQAGPLPSLSATALLQKAAAVGATGHVSSTMAHLDMHATTTWHTSADRLTRDFLGLTDQCGGGNVDHGEGSGGGEALGGLDYQSYDRGHSLLKHQGFGFAHQLSSSETSGNC